VILMKAIRFLVLSLFWLIMLWGLASLARAQCPQFTAEQQWLLDAGCAYGRQHDLCAETMAVIWQESFDCFGGAPVCRVNVNDGLYGSYGVMQVQLTTALWMLDWPINADNADVVQAMIMANDVFGIKLGVAYLVLHRERGLHDMLAKYRGTGEDAHSYAHQVMERMETFKSCGVGYA